MGKDVIFPFTIRCRDNGSFVDSPREFQPLVVAEAKRQGESWYAFDVTLVSETFAEIKVYGMRCNVYGGIGQPTFSFHADVPSALTRQHVVYRACKAAEESLRQERDLERAMQEARRTDEILSARAAATGAK